MINNKIELLEKIKNQLIKEYLFNNVELKRSWDTKYGKRISSLCNKINLKKMWFIVGIEDNGILSRHSESWAKSTEEIIS